MDKVMPISSTNTDYYQWGKNCKLLKYDVETTTNCLEAYPVIDSREI